MSTAPKIDPGDLALRAQPRRIVRFRRWLVITVAALSSGAILGVTILALQSPGLRDATKPEELYNTERKPTPDGLATLPADYSHMKPEMPVLGPPLPGDLGRPILEQQRRQGGVAQAGEIDQVAEMERQRQAGQARQARESGVFFRVGQQPAVIGAAREVGAEVALAGAGTREDPSHLALDPDRDQNNQQRKLDFLARKDGSGIYNPHALQKPVSPHTVMAGSVIAASLITGINSDLPGLVTAQVTENVHDSVTGRILLIPQGSRLVGSYDSVVAYGQSRALLVWQRIIRPDGSSIEIDNLPATDAAGRAGLEDEVDYHTGRLLKGIVLATLLGVGMELSFGSGESDLIRAIRESTQQNADRAGQRITDKNLNIQPTITIRSGWPLRVIVHKDLILTPYRGG